MKTIGIILLLISIGWSIIYGQETTIIGNSDPTNNAAIQTVLQMLTEKLPRSACSCQNTIEMVTNRLINQFDTWLQCRTCYRDTVVEECAFFPEGRIYSFAIPALAYVNVALQHPPQKSHAIEQIAKLIDLMIPIVITDIQPPENDLLKLRTYQDEATYIGTLNLVLSHYALLSGDTRYRALHAHLSDILYQALVASKGESLHSYPEYTWHFDTLFVLWSLQLEDVLTGRHRADELIRQHLTWKQQHATDPATGLPSAYGTSLPRGCDLSMQIAVLSQFAPNQAQKLYPRYLAAHWIDQGFLAGFSEWPQGKHSSQGDFDSGPIVFNVALTATGIGLATTQAMNDSARFERLCCQLNFVPPMMQALASINQNNTLSWWFQNGVGLNPTYFSGMLYGDAMLFYALTWVPYPEHWR